MTRANATNAMKAAGTGPKVQFTAFWNDRLM